MVSQIAHIIYKDWRQSRLVIAAFLVLLGTLTVLTSRTHTSEISLFVLQLLLFLTVLLITVSFVQADSPTRSDAHWRTTPLSGGRLAVAKYLGIALLLFPIFFIGETIALQGNGVAINSAVGFAGEVTIPYAGTLVLTMLLAAVTPDIKAFLVAFVAQLTLFTLIGMSETLKTQAAFALEVRWLHWMGLAPVVLAALVLHWVYTRRWTADQSRVAAVAVLLVIPLLHLAVRAGAINIIQRQHDARQSIPASNYSARIVGDTVMLSFAVKRPNPGDALTLRKPVARVKVRTGRWYHLGAGFGSPVFEDEMKKNTVYSSSVDLKPDIPLPTYAESVTRTDGDSLQIMLKLTYSPSVIDSSTLRNSAIEFSSTLLMLRRSTSVDSRADTSYARPDGSSLSFSAAPISDDELGMQVRSQAFASQPNVVRDVFYGEDASYKGRQLREWGLAHYGPSDTALLVSDTRRDTVRLTKIGCGGGRSATIFLPVPFSGITDAAQTFCGDSASKQADISAFVKHARFEYHTWAYSGHIPLRATVRLPRN